MTLTRARIEKRLTQLDAWNGNGLHPEDAVKEQAEIEFEKEICRLALFALAPATQWREISSAPKDGTRVQVLSSEVQHTAMFHAGRWIVSKGDGTEDIIITGLTHWQPLPPPPGTEATPPQGERDGWSEIDDAAFAWFVGIYALLNLGTQREEVLSKMAPFETVLYDTCWIDDRFQKRLTDLNRLDGIEKGGGG